MSKKKLAVLLGLIAITSSLIYLEMTHFAPQRVKLRIEMVESTRIPASFNNLSIGFLSDVYSHDDNLDKALKELDSFKPDMIIFGGNLFKAAPSEKEQTEMIEKLSKLNAKLGKYAVLGENDIRKANEVTQAVLTKSGFKLISNTKIDVHNFTNESIQLVGIDANNDINKETEFPYPSTSEDIFNITIANNPDNVKEFDDTEVDLMLSGKTMGGYIRLPLIGSITESSDYINKRQTVDETTLIISSGIGLKEPEMRLLSNPDVMIVILKSPEA
ncbi:metallophosphoesterase [Erysipelothrix rhusiopathiae]|uniref:metallophosphoesterase n=1 Tax=Erysipelothrix sp. strain 2 (EsS2-7-Brazil) TaxID=2500579 RepID=UPI001376FB2E|nr:metallophosphoesterase [Erysipelothrix sp. strain 2 (EsS2-7-Brazil)]MBK2404066.1 metallophosphoesterase [Erysipelothrix sp. strain 2 (EsS2-7-Brazil)]NBA00882.1 metallophosphoesterase [Erysipelothrix rhusiopathiae]